MITEIEIGGYRLLDEFKADFTPLTVVIGANAVGKSTLIDCLQLIGECCEVPLNTAVGTTVRLPFFRRQARTISFLGKSLFGFLMQGVELRRNSSV